MYKIIKKINEIDFGGKFAVAELLVEVSNGKRTNFFIRNALPYSIVIPLLDSQTVIMVKQHRIGANEISLEFPMGIVKDKGPDDVARTELKEETGYTAKQLQQIAHFYLSPGWSNQKAYVFIADGLKEGRAELEPYEEIEVINIELAKIPQLIHKGKIFDASTITAFYYYDALFGNNAVNLR